VTAAQADGGAYVVSGIEGARSTIRFDGTSISLRTITGPAFGKAQVWIDGVLKKHLDLSAASTTYGVLRSVGGLADRVHTVRLVVVGVHGMLGSGANIAIDGWLVG
jgi:hypothetical protein